jgi:DNA-directed RNA polymerase beta subunit
MNIGQILEIHAGAAGTKLGINIATPILNGMKVEQVSELMEKA